MTATCHKCGRQTLARSDGYPILRYADFVWRNMRCKECKARAWYGEYCANPNLFYVMDKKPQQGFDGLTAYFDETARKL